MVDLPRMQAALKGLSKGFGYGVDPKSLEIQPIMTEDEISATVWAQVPGQRDGAFVWRNGMLTMREAPFDPYSGLIINSSPIITPVDVINAFK